MKRQTFETQVYVVSRIFVLTQNYNQRYGGHMYVDVGLLWVWSMRRQLPLVTIRYNFQHTMGAVCTLRNMMCLLSHKFLVIEI